MAEHHRRELLYCRNAEKERLHWLRARFSH